jgi:DNA polymerase III subunit delta
LPHDPRSIGLVEKPEKSMGYDWFRECEAGKCGPQVLGIESGCREAQLVLICGMPSQTFDALQRELKSGALSSVYYFHGPEDVLKDEAVRQLLDRALEPAFRDFNFDQRSAPQLEPEALYALLNTLPMMAERRVVVLREVEALKRKARVKSVLEDYLKKPSQDTLLILVQGSAEPKADPSLSRGTTEVAFAALSPERTLRWITHYARQQRVELAPDAATHLFESVGNDLGMLRMELDKIASLEHEGPVNLEAVAAQVGVRRGETLISWRDLVLGGSAAASLPLVGPVLEQAGMSGVKMVSALGTALIGLRLARPYYERGIRDRALAQKIMGNLLSIRPFGLGDWRAESDKWAKWAPVWPLPRIRSALRATLEADTALKNTRISDERGVVTDLVLQLTAQRWGEAA